MTRENSGDRAAVDVHATVCACRAPSGDSWDPWDPEHCTFVGALFPDTGRGGDLFSMRLTRPALPQVPLAAIKPRLRQEAAGGHRPLRPPDERGGHGDGARPRGLSKPHLRISHRRVTSALGTNTKPADSVREKLVFTLHLKAVSPAWCCPGRRRHGEGARGPGLAQDRGVRVEETPADGRTQCRTCSGCQMCDLGQNLKELRNQPASADTAPLSGDAATKPSWPPHTRPRASGLTVTSWGPRLRSGPGWLTGRSPETRLCDGG